jgi:hypothetical protein
LNVSPITIPGGKKLRKIVRIRVRISQITVWIGNTRRPPEGAAAFADALRKKM